LLKSEEVSIQIVSWLSPTLLWIIQGLEDIEKSKAIYDALAGLDASQLTEINVTEGGARLARLPSTVEIVLPRRPGGQ